MEHSGNSLTGLLYRKFVGAIISAVTSSLKFLSPQFFFKYLKVKKKKKEKATQMPV